MIKIKPTRRSLQFSLRAFLILFTALAVWLGWQANRVRRQFEAIRSLQQAGGAVGYRPPLTNLRVVPIEYFGMQLSWRDCFRIPTDVALSGEAANDELCRYLVDLPGLRRLEFHDANITCDSAVHIGRLKHLERFCIWNQDLWPAEADQFRRLLPEGCEFMHMNKPGRPRIYNLRMRLSPSTRLEAL
ncbi:MAG TPA: hypothetical protein VHB99_16230 [Pirellulales bacterium]|nr:hypothetical protein [Pirellulales bacterium]